jgi:shikimate dehydrogenase
MGLVGGRYRAIDCDEDRLLGTLLALDEEGLTGVSLTMPLKRAVVPLVSATDGVVDLVGVANTVLFGSEGRWIGANTDVGGFVLSLARAGLRVVRGDVWLLGGGATACSALAGLAELGVTEAVVVARHPAAATAVRDVAHRCGVSLDVRPWSEAIGAAAAELVMACVPPGATDSLAPDIARARPRGLWYDVVYVPWPTPAAAAWQSAGGRIIGGLELLIEQAAEQIRLMSGIEAPLEVMRAAGEFALRRLQ